MAEESKLDKPVMMPSVERPSAHVLKALERPYRPPESIAQPGQPRMIDTMVTWDQICVVRNGRVEAQCNCPEDINDYPAWQEVMLFVRRAKGLMGPKA